MSIKTTDYNFSYDLSDKDLQSVLILPSGINEKFKGRKVTLYTESSISVLKKLKQNAIKADFAIGSPVNSIYIDNRSNDWVGPTLYFSFLLISQNPAIVSICLYYRYQLQRPQIPQESLKGASRA